MTYPHERFARRRATVAIALMAGAAASAGIAHAEDYSKTLSVSSKPTVHVVTNDGSVSVRSGETAKVDVRVEYPGFTLDKTLHIESAQRGDRAELTARINKFVLAFGQTRRLHIDIRVPQNADLEIETSDGAVKASSVSGAISLHTGDGAIAAEHLTGTLDLHTGDGGIAVSSLAGDVRLGPGDGAIEGRDIDGQFEAISRDGRIQLAGRFDRVAVKSSDGGVDVRALPGSKLASAWTIATGLGSVTVALPRTVAANLEASSGDGRVRLDIPVEVEGSLSASKVHGKIDGGGQTLTIHTGDGSIHLLVD